MDDYVPKPVSREDLAAVLKRWIPTVTPEEARQEGPTGSAPANGPKSEPVDRRVLEDLEELGGVELVGELIQTLLEDAPSRLKGLQEAVRAGEAPAVRRLAHALKGSCGSMGAVEMTRLAGELERAGASWDLSRSQELLERLEEDFRRVRAALETERTA